MGQYFSLAYCTIAATSAEDSTRGFIGPRQARQCVKIPNMLSIPLYIYENINDYYRDVEE
jgi:hypothetical protein